MKTKTPSQPLLADCMPIIQEVGVGGGVGGRIQDQAQKHSELKDSQDEEITPDNDSLK